MQELFDQYTDSVGLVQNQIPDPAWPYKTSANGILFTVEAMLVQEENGPMTLTQKDKYLSAIKKCRLIPGLYSRWPLDLEQEAVDDYIALATLSSLYDPSIAQEILSYGRGTKYKYGPLSFKYYYQNDPLATNDVRAWLGRFPQLVAQLQWAAGERPAFWRQLWWALAIATSGFNNPDDTNAWTLSWVAIQGAPKDNIICHFAEAIWKWRLKKKWGSMRLVFGRYFGAAHPIAVCCLS